MRRTFSIGAAILAVLAIILAVATMAGCGGTASRASNLTPQLPAPTPTPIPTSPPPQASSHVVVVMEENHSYEQVIGNSSMPWLNGLASQYALAKRYFANAHPSIPNYFMVTTGQVVTYDDSFSGTADVNNLARILSAGSKSWRVYAEDLPAAGYTGGSTGAYLKRHNPFAYFSDVVNSPAVAANMVQFSQFAADLAAGTLPNFSFVVPNANNDAHDGSLATADSWLNTNIAPLLSSPQFQTDGLLLIVFDEGAALDIQQIGGHVPVVIAGPKVKRGFQSTTFYQHQSTLRLILKALGVTTFPGASGNAPEMTEFFQ